LALQAGSGSYKTVDNRRPGIRPIADTVV